MSKWSEGDSMACSYNGADVKTLSELPSKDEMRAQLLATLEAPLSQTLSVMEALIVQRRILLGQ